LELSEFSSIFILKEKKTGGWCEMAKRIQPSLNENAFNCPRCGVLCPHMHYEVKRRSESGECNISIEEIKLAQTKFIGKPRGIGSSNYMNVGDGNDNLKSRRRTWDLYITICTHCHEYTIWENQNIIYPFETTIPEAFSDMPDEVKRIYEEAQQVYQHSPRASAALLRLAIETLIPELNYGIKKDNLFNMIGKLVKEDIPNHVQKGLDSLRYYGNKGIHTAEIDMKDDEETVVFLFKLCNMIVEELITKKKEINDFYEVLPERFRSSVEKRDTIKK
jgi:Domain of unknown function (DUF4145)